MTTEFKKVPYLIGHWNGPHFSPVRADFSGPRRPQPLILIALTSSSSNIKSQRHLSLSLSVQFIVFCLQKINHTRSSGCLVFETYKVNQNGSSDLGSDWCRISHESSLFHLNFDDEDDASTTRFAFPTHRTRHLFLPRPVDWKYRTQEIYHSISISPVVK